MTNPTRFPNGVNNLSPIEGGADICVIDPTKAHVYFNDFDTYTAAEWTITTVEDGAGSATEALADADGGVLLITNDDADNDADYLNKVGESFLMAAGKKAMFKARLKINDPVESQMLIGLQVTDTTPLTVSDGIYFRIDNGNADVDLVTVKGSTETVTLTVATMVANTNIDLAWVYNGVDRIEVFVDGVLAATEKTLTNLPDDEELTVSVGLKNGEAVVKTMSIDYILAIKER